MLPYYQDEYVTLYCGDCREIVPTLGQFDLLLTDPPYKITATGGGIAKQCKYLSDIAGFTDCDFDDSILDYCENWMCFCSISQMLRLITKASIRRWMLLTWNKPNPTPLTNGNYLPDTEYIVHSFMPNCLHGEYKDKSRFIVYPAQHGNLHPNEKPITVVSKLILVGTGDGQSIVDPFAGSGTTGVAAKLLNRKCTLIEKEEKDCEIAARRLSQGVLPLWEQEVE